MAISDNDPRPPYLQLADQLRRKIRVEKQYKPGQRLPSIRELAAEAGISPQTVQNALRELRIEGLIVAQQGRALFVRSDDEPMGSEGGSVVGRLAEMERRLRELTERVAALEGGSESRGDGRG
ncbi:GntR family transcriptional regulator [Streptosporangium sp. NPDC006007]|uniref:GntR family transcriptional regulator n=1 Tax=Streptosporangium sp. NPDC006007 TaxID=3154575 RepID=UPI0033A9D623